jgi:hypothetical protein
LGSRFTLKQDQQVGRPSEKMKEQKEQAKPKDDKLNRTIDVKELEVYFTAQFKGMGGNLNYFDTMINELKTDRTAKEFAQIAYMIYQSRHMNSRKPATFSAWYKIFCKSIGIIQSKDYRPNKLKNPSEALRKLFNYL